MGGEAQRRQGILVEESTSASLICDCVAHLQLSGGRLGKEGLCRWIKNERETESEGDRETGTERVAKQK